jgi:hypothetical protein
VPDRFKYKTKGLLGIFDNDVSNDFTLPDGSFLVLNASDDREIFYKFGEQWKLNANNTIFSYLGGFSKTSFTNGTFVPKFVSDGIMFENSVIEELAKQKCGNNTNCLFDISTTGELSIDDMSFEFSETVEAKQESIVEASRARVPLNSIFENDFMNITTLPNGFEHHFNCNIDYCLNGSNVVKCIDSIYDLQPPQCVECPKDPKN